ncbi:MAG: collagen-like protein [Thermoleophilaceae bacterium]|nr:collagen-like protein [Thermoleophilaceae bacterium]
MTFIPFPYPPQALPLRFVEPDELTDIVSQRWGIQGIAGPAGATGPVGPAGPTGPQGPQGIPAAAFVHTQSSASTEWIVSHNLGFHPDIAVFVGGTEVDAEIIHVDLNQSRVYFAAAQVGEARCS